MKFDAVHEFPAVPINFHVLRRFHCTVIFKIDVHINDTVSNNEDFPSFIFRDKNHDLQCGHINTSQMISRGVNESKVIITYFSQTSLLFSGFWGIVSGCKAAQARSRIFTSIYRCKITDKCVEVVVEFVDAF
jgi:hypothetical protein